jgi:hypothetical protein
MVGFKLVNPVTTASGNSTGTTGVGVGSIVGVGCDVVGAVDEPASEGTGEGLALPQPARSDTIRSSPAARFVVRFNTALS